MVIILKILLLLTGSYLFGAIPFGYLTVRLFKGLDIRKYGSGNIGATNVVRAGGLKLGIPVFLLDFSKGTLPVLLAADLLSGPLSETPVVFHLVIILIVIAAVCGHNWPVYMGFKGGKGVAVTIGALTGLSIVFSFLRIPVIMSILVWPIIFYMFRVVSLASISAALVFLSVSVFAPAMPILFKIMAVLLCAFIVIRHRKNYPEILLRLKGNK